VSDNEEEKKTDEQEKSTTTQSEQQEQHEEREAVLITQAMDRLDELYDMHKNLNARLEAYFENKKDKKEDFDNEKDETIKY